MNEQPKSPMRPDREFVQSLARGLSIIQAFGPDRPKMTLAEAARATNMTRAAARRFLQTLETLGFVKSDGRDFRLQPSILCLGYAYLSSMNWWQVAQPYMEDVSKAVRDSCSASVLDRDDVVYVARVPATRTMAINLNVGSRLPAFCTSMGRVLLAHLPQAELDRFFAESNRTPQTNRTVTDERELREILDGVREKEHCLVDQELELGLRSVAVPVFDRDGNCIAAINIASHVSRVSRKQMMSDILPVLRDASRSITAALQM